MFESLSKAGSERALRDYNPPFPSSSDPARYGRHAKGMFAGQTSLDMTGFNFRPAFITNGLRLLPELSDLHRRFVLDVLATGVREFADYFLEQEVSASGGVSETKQSELKAMQKRYFAYCLAQLLQCGMDFEGVLMMMKGDAMDMAVSKNIA